MHFRRLFKLRQPLVDQVVADMRHAHGAARGSGAARFGGAVVRQLDRFARDVAFRELAFLRDLFNGVPVSIARGEIHRAVDAGRIFAQLEFDRAHGFDERAPVDRAEKTQAADAVADRDLAGGLALRFDLDQLLDGGAVLGQSLLDPRQRQGQRRALALQAACQLGDKRTQHRRCRTRHVGDDENQTLRVRLGDFHHAVGPIVGEFAVDGAGGDAGGGAAQIFDQRKAQHDRDRPQFAELERSDFLVRDYEAVETFRVDPAVAVRNGLESDVVDAWESGGGAAREPRQFAAVAFWQMVPGRADLLFDQVKIVEQPFAGRGDAAVCLDRRAEQVAGVAQNHFVFSQPREQLIGRAPVAQAVHAGQIPAVLLHLVGAEQLRAQRRFVLGELACRVLAKQACRQIAQGVENLGAAQSHFNVPSKGAARDALVPAMSTAMVCRASAAEGPPATMFKAVSAWLKLGGRCSQVDRNSLILTFASAQRKTAY